MTPGDDEVPGGGALSAVVLERLEGIGTVLDTVSRRIEAVAARERRTRRLTWGLAVSIILDVTLTVVVSVLSANALSQGSTLHRSQLAACAIGNQTRLGDVELWGYVLRLSAKSPNSDQAQLRMFKAFVDTTFAPVDCAGLYR